MNLHWLRPLFLERPAHCSSSNKSLGCWYYHHQCIKSFIFIRIIGHNVHYNQGNVFSPPHSWSAWRPHQGSVLVIRGSNNNRRHSMLACSATSMALEGPLASSPQWSHTSFPFIIFLLMWSSYFILYIHSLTVLINAHQACWSFDILHIKLSKRCVNNRVQNIIQ